MDEHCPSHCTNTVVETVEDRQVFGCLDCGSAGYL